MDKHFTPGQPVWVIERDEYNKETEVTGFIFIAEVTEYAIVSAYINDIDDLDYIMEYHAKESMSNYTANLTAFPIEDCYSNKEEAHKALEEENNN